MNIIRYSIRDFGFVNDNCLKRYHIMNIIQTNIPGVLIIEPRVFKDSSGYFFESFSQREFDEPTNEARAKSNLFELCLARRRKTEGQKVMPILGHRINFVQDNESISSYVLMRILIIRNQVLVSA